MDLVSQEGDYTTRLFAAIDIGGTAIKYGIINEEGSILYHSQTSTEIKRGISYLEKSVISIVNDLLERERTIVGIGISTTGVVDSVKGVIIHAGETMPGYTGTNWKLILATHFDLPVVVHNDVNAAALGEAWLGAGRKLSHFFCMTLGTGIGGALILDGKLIEGVNHRTGEIGYMVTGKNRSISYEQNAATSTLEKNAQIKINDLSVTGEEIFRRAKNGDEGCEELINGWTREVAYGIANIICIIDPGTIIIGGAVSRQGDFLIRRIYHALNCLPKSFIDSTRIIPAQCGNNSGLLGAVYHFV